ncbi:unnamed protein product [Litomosoides sigmodontis]|uniref:Uncharacterized protein n=1 Tax=Litomosoides sigmodontis TaxID=42156 RepID=A0A3P7JVG3_LITSI|nr:unnamed protein product [Litomosoides sigmodontis]
MMMVVAVIGDDGGGGGGDCGGGGDGGGGGTLCSSIPMKCQHNNSCAKTRLPLDPQPNKYKRKCLNHTYKVRFLNYSKFHIKQTSS